MNPIRLEDKSNAIDTGIIESAYHKNEYGREQLVSFADASRIQDDRDTVNRYLGVQWPTGISTHQTSALADLVTLSKFLAILGGVVMSILKGLDVFAKTSR